MILHKHWGEIVRLGNFLFKYASLMGFSKKYDTELYLPNHYMFDYLKTKPKVDNNITWDIEITERSLLYDPEYWDSFSNDFKNKRVNITLSSFLQTYKYWEENIEYVKEMYRFKEDLIDNIKNKYKEELSKKTIGLSIRRGDFIGHNLFFQIAPEFYLYNVNKYFENPNEYNIIIFCDDRNWSLNYFKGDNIYYADGNFVGGDYNKNPMEQLMLGSLCDNFVISNSTFSWWLAYLAVNCKENSDGKVIHSGKWLTNGNKSNPEEYYHHSWIKSDYYN